MNLVEIEPWMEQGACVGSDPELFFPGSGRHGPDVAKSICAQCSVVGDCLDYAIRYRVRYGVWGGTNETERRILIRAES